MTGAAQPTNAETLIGPLTVRPDRQGMAAFADALGLAPGVRPLTFPIRWLALPPVRTAMEDAIGRNPLHAAQTFDFDRQLGDDRDYVLNAMLTKRISPSPRLVVHGKVSEPDGRGVVRFETVLLPTAAIAKVRAAGPAEAAAGSLPDIDFGAIDEAQAARYAAAAHDDSRLHADADFARSLGLDGPIVHGMLMMGLLQRALSEWPVSSTVMRLFVLFTRPVLVGTRLAVGGRIVVPATTQHAGRQIVRLFIRTDRDEIACIGEAVLAAPGFAAP